MSLPALREIVLPELDLGSARPKVGRWLAPLGSVVVAGDAVVEILAGGVAIAIPSPTTGRLTCRLASEGQAVTTGQHLGFIEEEPPDE